MGPLREQRLTRLHLAGLGALSALATALVIANALGRTDAQRAALVALRHRPVIVDTHSAPSASPQPVTASPGAVVPAASWTPSPPAATPTSSPAAPASTGTSATTQTTPHITSAPRRKIGHVFVVALSTPSFAAAFGGQSLMPYLSRTLRREGTLLRGYRTLGSSELPDYLGMVSGQNPNPDTTGGCATYSEFPPGAAAGADGLVAGTGCVYPITALTLGDQVTASGHSWRAYLQDMGPATCAHPNSGAPDGVPLPGTGTDYAIGHNPFVYFHSLLDLGSCVNDDVGLTQLPADLRTASRTPTFSFIAPGACLDAAASSCPGGGPMGVVGEDAFLRQWVPRILHSRAYRRDGVLIIVFADSSDGQATDPADPANAPVSTGALVLSRYARRGKTVSSPYTPYSVLRSVEQMLGYKPLGRAKSAVSFVPKVLSRAG